MEEDQQHTNSKQVHLTVQTTPSPEESLTPPDSGINTTANLQNQRPLNPKKRIISQLEEAKANSNQNQPLPQASSPSPTPEQSSPTCEAQSVSS